MTSFRVDVLLKTLEELQQEKGQNERVLAEEYGKRKNLESKAENAMSTLSQTADIHARVMETLRMEEQRVAETQGKIEKYEQVNDGIRERITRLNQQIKESEEDRRSSLEDFECKMGKMIEQFHSGWQNMEESTLDNEVNQYREQKSNLIKQAEAHRIKITSLMEEIEKQNSKLGPPDKISASLLDEVCKMFEAENKASKAAMEKNQHDLCLKELEDELVGLRGVSKSTETEAGI